MARLTNQQSGQPLPGNSVNLAFSLYPVGGNAPVETIAAQSHPMADGVVSVALPFKPASFDGTGRELTYHVDGGEESGRILLTAVPYAYRVHRVASEELDDNIMLGEHGTGRLTINRLGNPSIVGDAQGSALELLSLYPAIGGANGRRARLGGSQAGAGGGLLEMWSVFDLPTAQLGTHLNGNGGYLSLYNRDGNVGAQLDGNSSGGGLLRIYNGVPGSPPAIELDPTDGVGGTGARATLTDGANETIRLDAHEPPNGGALVALSNGQQETIRLDARNGAGGGQMILSSRTAEAVRLQSDQGDGGARLTLANKSRDTVEIDANDGDDGSRVSLYNEMNVETIRLDACGGDDAATGGGGSGGTRGPDETWSTCGGGILVRNGQDRATVEIDGDEKGAAVVRVGAGDGGADGQVWLYTAKTPAGTGATIGLNGESSTIHAGWAGSASGSVWLYSAAGTFGDGPTIHLDGGSGWGTFKVVQITGGGDLAEPFDVRREPADEEVKPGMVVSIDPHDAGKLVVSRQAYDRTVAGVISGAGGVRPGMVMGQTGTMASGEHPVALTGRVYCYCDASSRSIRPGDLLTTSDLPGHAMKVVDHAKAQGAILGKAMSTLGGGQGLVLVLVSLQ